MAALGAKLRFRGRTVSFWCPGCRRAHIILVSSDAVPYASPCVFDGNCDCPTFTPSIMINPPGPMHNPDAPVCHFFVTKGRMLFLQDCTHPLAGQTVDLPDYPTERVMTTEKTHEGLPVAGYRPQDGTAVQKVNTNKVAEERVLRILDDLAADPEVDKRWLAIGRTQIEQGFMAVNRAVFKPGRAVLPEERD
jgi:hypothetical protein